MKCNLRTREAPLELCIQLIELHKFHKSPFSSLIATSSAFPYYKAQRAPFLHSLIRNPIFDVNWSDEQLPVFNDFQPDACKVLPTPSSPLSLPHASTTAHHQSPRILGENIIRVTWKFSLFMSRPHPHPIRPLSSSSLCPISCVCIRICPRTNSVDWNGRGRGWFQGFLLPPETERNTKNNFSTFSIWWQTTERIYKFLDKEIITRNYKFIRQVNLKNLRNFRHKYRVTCYFLSDLEEN